jgi:hypothetical protein
MLVQEARDGEGRRVGLRLAEATPRLGARIAVTNAPTSFGPVSFSIESHANGADVSVDVPARSAPDALSVRLRLPQGLRIGSVAVGGKPYPRFDRGTGTIDLTGRHGTVQLSVVYRRVRL